MSGRAIFLEFLLVLVLFTASIVHGQEAVLAPAPAPGLNFFFNTTCLAFGLVDTDCPKYVPITSESTKAGYGSSYIRWKLGFGTPGNRIKGAAINIDLLPKITKTVVKCQKKGACTIKSCVFNDLGSFIAINVTNAKTVDIKIFFEKKQTSGSAFGSVQTSCGDFASTNFDFNLPPPPFIPDIGPISAPGASAPGGFI